MTDQPTGQSTDQSTGLTATQAAARLGVKRETIYAYVSRGLLPRRVAADGRTSLFDPNDVDRLRTGGRDDEGELRTLIATGLTRIEDRTVWIRGEDLIGRIGDGLDFPGAVDLLWDSPPGEQWAHDGWADSGADPEGDPAGGPVGLTPLDELRVIAARASSADPLRHELSPKSVRAAGRSLIQAMARGAAGTGAPGDSPTQALWRRLHPEPVPTRGAVEGVDRNAEREATEARIRALDVALALMVDHGLAGSTFAARIAASVRADPYAVVGAGLGALGGALHGAAGSAVHELLVDAERRGDAAAALGDARLRLGRFPGVGHSVYRSQDPRYGALMARLTSAWGDDPRLVNVYRIRDLIGERTEAIPNVDLALGTLSYLARMPPAAGEVIFAIARTAGWLAHAMEEYDEQPLRFRARARYTGR